MSGRQPRAQWWLHHFADIYTAVAVTFLIAAVLWRTCGR